MVILSEFLLHVVLGYPENKFVSKIFELFEESLLMIFMGILHDCRVDVQQSESSKTVFILKKNILFVISWNI